MVCRCKCADREKKEKQNGEQATQEHAEEKTVGPHTKAGRKEKGNGTQLRMACQKQRTIPMETWETPKSAKQDKWKQQKPNEDMARERWGSEIRGEYATTWTIHDGDISREIDYIMINAKHWNVTRKAQSNIYWLSNMNQNQQRRVQKMQLCYNVAREYKKPIPSETGKG